MKKLNTFLENTLNFGDYILFQEYTYDGEQYKISKPVMAIYLGLFVADQTLGFNYVRWNNDRHTEYITNEYVTNFGVCKQVKGIYSHIEWNDYIDILGKWKNKPTWKDIIKSYRNENTDLFINEDEIIED